MLKIPPHYRIPIGISVVLHIILLVILAIKLPMATVFHMQDARPEVKIVHAVVVNSAVQNEMDRIKTAEQQKQQQEQQKRIAEQAQLRVLQQQTIALQKQRQLEQARIVRLQAEHVAVKKQAEALAKQQALKLRKEKIAQQQKLLAKQRQLQQQLIQNQMAQEQKELMRAQATQLQGVLDQYKAQIIQAIQQQWLVPDNADKNLSCVLLIRLAPDGTVLSVETVQTSSDSVLDRSARDAVFKASPLPVPQDPAIFASFRELRLTVRPLTVTGG